MNKRFVATILIMIAVSTFVAFQLAATLIQTITPTWSTQTVTTGGSFGMILMVLDSNDNPQMVYKGENGLMYYVRWDGSNWKISGVIQGGTPNNFVLDSKDSPHILYEGANGVMYYASWDRSKWSYQTVPAGYGYSLALDSAGNPHVAYSVQLPVSEYPQGVTNDISMLNYASWNGSNWSIQTLDKPVSYTDSIYLALDSHDNPHIMYGYDTYYPPSGGNLLAVKIAVWNGSSWNFQTALSNLDYFGNMVLDSNGYPHFIYGIEYPHAYSNNSTLGYASWTGFTWNTQTVVSNAALGFSFQANLALDSHNRPHVEFFNGSLMYCSWTGTGWNIQTVAPDNFAYGEGPLALDSHDNPSICYWVNDIHNTTAFVSELIYTTTTSVLTPCPTPTPTASTLPNPSVSVSQLWMYTSHWSIVSSPILANGFIYLTSGTSGGGTQGLYCLDLSTGTEIWHHAGLFATFTAADGLVYVGETSEDSSYHLHGVLSCLNAFTGAQLWNYSAGTSFTTPMVKGGVVYVGGFGYTLSTDVNVGFVYAFNASTGEKLWNFLGPVGTRFDYKPLVLEGENLYAISAVYSSQDASWHSGVYAFNAYTGKELWNYTTLGQFGSFLAAGQNVYVSSNFVDTRNNLDAEESGGYIYEGGILALNASNGTLLWNFQIDSSVGTPVIMKNTVYVVSGDGILYAFNATGGRVTWSYTAGTGLGSLLPVSGYLYIGSSSGVYCFNSNNGEVIWNFAASDFADSSPTFPTYANGMMYVGWNGPMFFSHVTQHNFYALNASNGEKLWNYTLGYTVASSPLVENGTVYISGNFVSSRNPDFESSGAVLALKPSLTSLPFQSLFPTPDAVYTGVSSMGSVVSSYSSHVSCIHNREKEKGKTQQCLGADFAIRGI